MFTGIIEDFGVITSLEKEMDNLHITLKSSISSDLKIDQSVAHSGICMTVVAQEGEEYRVTAIRETLEKTNLGTWEIGQKVNLERAMKLGSRLDGHLVQGHVDQVGHCTKILEQGGSWLFSFEYDPALKNMTIEKGSITVNGTSLTVVNSGIYTFSVAIIPYTYENANFHQLKVGSAVNLEFDVIGKYIMKMNSIPAGLE
jgi:riboflavin synthase